MSTATPTRSTRAGYGAPARLARAVLLVLALAPAATRPATAQQETTPSLAADPADVGSVDAVLSALYDVISGPAGEARDWARFRSLFVPGAHLIATGRTPAGEVRHRVMTPEDYVASSGAYLEEHGFFEREVGRVEERFGNIAHSFSTYETRLPAEGDRIVRGINSIQLLYDGERWWVVSIFWDSERQDNPIPPKYLSVR